MGMFDDLRSYRKLLSAQMKYAPWYSDSFWVQFMGFIGNGEGKYPKTVNLGSTEAKLLSPTGKPIEVLTNFMNEGSDVMEIPLLNPLTNQPIFESQLLGNEEQRNMTYLEVYLHTFRHGVILRDSKLGEQRLKKPEVQKQLMSGAQEDLKDYFRRLIGYQPYLATLEKYSDNLTNTARGGGAMTPILHPNFYVAGTTKPTWSATPATYATNVANALGTLSDTSAKRMSASMIKSMCRLASQKKIRPTHKVGSRLLYDIVISTAGAVDLLLDEEFRTAMNYAYMGQGDKSRLEYGHVNGIVFDNAVIHVDENIPDAKVSGDTGWDSSKTVSFGNVNYMSDPISTGNKKLAILFGASFIGCGYASPLSFEQETWDYKAKKTEGAEMIVGFTRADIMDYDKRYGSTDFKENNSSLIVAHWGDDSVTL